MTHFYEVDAGGTTRLTKRFFAVDSGGTTRLIKRAFQIDSGGTARLFFTSNIFTLTSGQEGTTVYGYVAGGFGSISPSNVLSDGNTIIEIATAAGGPPPHAMTVQFHSAPSQSYLTSIIIDGVTFLGSAASFSSGVWTWSNGQDLAPFNSNHTIQINIT